MVKRCRVCSTELQAKMARARTILLRSVDQVRLERRQASQNNIVDFPPKQVCFQRILQRAQRIAISRETHCLIIADSRSGPLEDLELAGVPRELTPCVCVNPSVRRVPFARTSNA
jgi:hypothetical protein